jgi:hypothetical protein
MSNMNRSAKPVLISLEKNKLGEVEMGATTCLVPFIDNGGQRCFVERRNKLNILSLWDRRSNTNRRKIIDRREALNQKRHTGPERRVVFQK